METYKTLDSDQHQCCNCKKFFHLAHELKVHKKYRSCVSLRLLRDPPVTEELHSKSGSNGTSDTSTPQCDQVITNGLNEPDQNHVLNGDTSRTNIFDIFSSAQNPEECCSDFEDHITLDQLKKCVHLKRSSNPNQSSLDRIETNYNHLPNEANHLSDGNQGDTLNKDGVKKVVKFKENSKKLKTFHIKNLNRVKNKTYNSSSRTDEDSVNSDTESASSDLDPDYDKTSDKIPPQLIYINGRTYFSDQAVFVKKKPGRGALNASTVTQSSAVCTEASSTVQDDQTDSFLGSNLGEVTKHPADKPSSRDSEAVRSKSEQKSKDCSPVKMDLHSKKKGKCHLDKQRLITQSKSQHDENRRCLAMRGNTTLRRTKQPVEQQIVVNNLSSNCTMVTKKKKHSLVKSPSNKSANDDDDDELLRKKVKAVIEEFMKISTSEKKPKEKPFSNIRGGPKEIASNQKSLHERNSPHDKEYLPDRDMAKTISTTSNGAANKKSETIVELHAGEQQIIVERSSSELSNCHLCNTHCEDKAESEASMNLHAHSEPNICDICNNSFLFKDSLDQHMETCHKLFTSQETATKFCKRHQRIIQIIDHAIRSKLEPLQKRLEKRKLRHSENVNTCSPVACIVVEDEGTETCDVIETSLESSCIELLKPYMKIYSDAELLALSIDDF